MKKVNKRTPSFIMTPRRIHKIVNQNGKIISWSKQTETNKKATKTDTKNER
jgi:hypothetical protein